MSLFDHIKKKPDVKEESNKNEPDKNQPKLDVAVAQESDSIDPVDQIINYSAQSLKLNSLAIWRLKTRRSQNLCLKQT